MVRFSIIPRSWFRRESVSISSCRMDRLFDSVRELRQSSEIPLFLMVYCNTVYRRGVERFYREAKDAGVDAVLIVDMPPEEGGGRSGPPGRTGWTRFFLVAPTTSDRRLEFILESAGGFLYLASLLGVTGARERLSDEAGALLRTGPSPHPAPPCGGVRDLPPRACRGPPRKQGRTVSSWDLPS